ncbi:MAG: hypothetical protein LKJ43_03205 [Lentilactobacillus buchneri]|jgi:hypothetical protein|nr:hypothetical protein [Lentilactobacillus buchneri]MCI1950720.1 hypothetical protein [Lentilactobacillus buchneri]MCI2018204.1 hypothetical protein [Lentilactobacillus buchneri]MCI2027846.1 hypothetical protein [Lentilactobacillus buchneri]
MERNHLLYIGLGMLLGLVFLSLNVYADDTDSSADNGSQVGDVQQTNGMTEDPEERDLLNQQKDSQSNPDDFAADAKKASETPKPPVKVRRNGYPEGRYQVPKFMQGYWKGYGKPSVKYAGYKFYSNWWKSFDTDIYNYGGKWYGQREYSDPYKIYKKPYKDKLGWWVISSVMYIKADPEDSDPYWSYSSNSDKDVFFIKYISKRHIKLTKASASYRNTLSAQPSIYDLRKLK